LVSSQRGGERETVKKGREMGSFRVQMLRRKGKTVLPEGLREERGGGKGVGEEGRFSAVGEKKREF